MATTTAAGAIALLILSPSFAAPVIKPPELVKDIQVGSGSSFPQVLTNVNGTLFFTADDGVHGNELWKSDGTPGGTVMVADINPSGSSSPGILTNVNGTLFFQADNGTDGRELWKSEPPYNTATMVADINAGAGSSNPHNLTNVNGTLFFAADPGSGVFELCTSTGGSASCIGNVPSNPAFLTNLNGTVYFRAEDSEDPMPMHGPELWKSTGGGAELVKDINPGIQSSFIQKIANINGTLYLAASDGVNGIELWKSDGTADGTVMVKDINPGGGFSLGEGGELVKFAEYNGSLIFMANDLIHGNELWISDGTPDGTMMVADIRPGSIGSNPGGTGNFFTNARGRLFFQANDGVNGARLWQSDGTLGGTFMVSSEGSSPSWITNVNNNLLFAAGDATHGFELWQSGVDGTKMVADIRPGTPSSSPSWFASVGGVLFFQANDFVSGAELWKYDVVAPENHNDVVLNLPSGVTVLLNNNSSSYVLHSDTAEAIALADVDNNGIEDIIVSFPSGKGPDASGGTYISKNQGALTLLSTHTAEIITAGNFTGSAGDDLFLDFGTSGLWASVNGSAPFSVVAASPVAMASGDVDKNGQDDLILSLNGLGTWVFKNLSAPLVPLDASAAQILATGDVDNNGEDDIIASFPAGTGPTSSGGTWIAKNQAGLSLLTSDTAESIAVGNFDGIGGEDLFIKFSGGVALSFEGAQPVPIFNFPIPVAMATGDVDESGKDDLVLSVGFGTFIIKNLSTVQPLNGSVALDIVVGNVDGN